MGAAVMVACGDDERRSPTGPTSITGDGTVGTGGLGGGISGLVAEGNGGNGNGSGNGNAAAKVDICHIRGNGVVDLLNVSANALPAHRGHGDAIPGELVPGSATLVFNETCAQVQFSIDIEKATEGMDADEPIEPVLVVGDPVNWTYDVTNTGQVALIDVAVTDDRLGAITCPGDTLAAGASMTCTASGTVQVDQYANTGTASGTTKGVDGQEGNLIPANQGHPSDEDPSHYFGQIPEAPAIRIEKATNGEDADSIPGPEILEGLPVTWTYVVTNVGDVALSNVSVTDSPLGAITCPTDTLDVSGPTATLTCTETGTATTGQYTNTGTAAGSRRTDRPSRTPMTVTISGEP